MVVLFVQTVTLHLYSQLMCCCIQDCVSLVQSRLQQRTPPQRYLSTIELKVEVSSRVSIVKTQRMGVHQRLHLYGWIESVGILFQTMHCWMKEIHTNGNVFSKWTQHQMPTLRWWN